LGGALVDRLALARRRRVRAKANPADFHIILYRMNLPAPHLFSNVEAE